MKKKQSFDEAMQELETLLASIESGTLGLDETLDAYEKGIKLSKELEKQLDEKKGRIQKILGDDTVVSLETEESDEDL